MSLADLMATHTSSVFFNTEHFATACTVTRGGDTISVTALPIAWDAIAQDADGIVVRQRLQQVLIQSSEYTWGDNLHAYPAIGDRITFGGQAYEVFRPSGADHSYEWEDTERTIYRIHLRELR